jgi:NAD(P)-dependent dehydrogenase (short-subunit alcohol dehydrogenase family)
LRFKCTELTGEQDGKTYNRWAAYGQSKTANMLFSRSLAQKLGNRGVTSVSVHPGISQTPLSKDLKMEDFMEIGKTTFGIRVYKNFAS